MREILFKAKRLDNGEWVEGYYMRHENRMIAPVGDTLKDEDVDHIILFSGFADWNMPRDIRYAEVDPSTVCEYTGLTDKHGNKIFEGDIIRTTKYGVDDGEGNNSAGTDTFAVVFAGRFNLRPDVDIEICGSIHDEEGGKRE